MSRNSFYTVTAAAVAAASMSLAACAPTDGHPATATRPSPVAGSAAVSGVTPPTGASADPSTGMADDAAFHQYVDAAVNDVAEYWRRELPRVTGTPWTEINYLLVDGDEIATDPSCGPAGLPTSATPTANPAFWCPASSTIYLSTRWLHDEIYAIQMPGDVDGKFGVAVVVAHEFGHAIQSQLDIGAPAGSTTVAPTELQADCLAGTWSADEDATSPVDREELLGGVLALSTIGDTGLDRADHHGLPKERVEAFTTGFENADPQVCTTTLGGAM